MLNKEAALAHGTEQDCKYNKTRPRNIISIIRQDCKSRSPNMSRALVFYFLRLSRALVWLALIMTEGHCSQFSLLGNCLVF
jgi:hypothetical protein